MVSEGNGGIRGVGECRPLQEIKVGNFDKLLLAVLTSSSAHLLICSFSFFTSRFLFHIFSPA